MHSKPNMTSDGLHIVEAVSDLSELVCQCDSRDFAESESDIYCRWAAALYTAGRADDAERIIRLSFEKGIDSANLRNNLCVILWNQGRDSEAREQAKVALILDPECADARHNLRSMDSRLKSAA